MSNLPLFPPAWAEVRAHDHVMRYRRSGVGRPVLLLSPAADPVAFWPGLAESLGAHFRVFVPELPPAARAHCVADFLEGLGVAGAAIVAAADLCLPALELALRDGDQVARLAIVVEGDATDDTIRGALAGVGGGRSTVPLLLLRRGIEEDEAVAQLSEFLAAA